MKDLSQLTKLHKFVNDDIFIREVSKVKQVRRPHLSGMLWAQPAAGIRA